MALVVLRIVEQRLQAVLLEVLNQGRTVTEVAARYGVARQTLHRWLGRYQTDGIDGLEDRSHRPKSYPHQMPVKVEAAVVALRRVHTHWGPRRLAWELEQRDIVERAPSASAIYRCLRRHGLVQGRKRRRRREDYKRWQRERPMELWQLDVVGGIALKGGRYVRVRRRDPHQNPRQRHCQCSIFRAAPNGGSRTLEYRKWGRGIGGSSAGVKAPRNHAGIDAGGLTVSLARLHPANGSRLGLHGGSVAALHFGEATRR